MKNGRVILQDARFKLTIERLCQQLIEEHGNFENTCLIGIQTKGVYLAHRMQQRLNSLLPDTHIAFGKLDITFYRDDFRTSRKPLKPNTTEIDFLIEQKKVVLIDDVVFTGRTIQAALTGLNHYGRPQKVELLTMVDRRFKRHLPIHSDFVGITVDSVDAAYVKVEWEAIDGRDQILIYNAEAE